MVFDIQSSGRRNKVCPRYPVGENVTRARAAKSTIAPSPVTGIEIDDEHPPIVVIGREFGGNAERGAAPCRP